MEYVSGGSVSDLIAKQGKLSVREATQITADACRGLMAAHAVGLVHRDVKPANLLRTVDGLTKVADFGLAKRTFDTARQITQAGRVVGTPYFMSPEQCEARQVDHRSDIYSLGATYYTLLTGLNPYENDGSVVQVMYAHCNAEVPDPRNSDALLPEACSHIVARAMAKKPEHRYQQASEMLDDLNAVASSLTHSKSLLLPSRAALLQSHKRSARWAILAGLLGLVVGGGLFALWWTIRGGHPPGAAALVTPSGPPLRVGVLHSLSGTMADSESPVVDAVQLAIEEINQAGGVLGRPVEAVVRDGRSDPEVFAQQATALLETEKVSTVFGCWTSAARKTVVPIFEQHGALLIYPVQYEGLEQSPHVVYLGSTPNQQIIPAIRWAFAFRGKRRFFVVGSDYIFPRAAGEVIRDTLRELGGELAGEHYLPLGSVELKPVVEQILAARPDVILNTINGDSNNAFFKELRLAGITPDAVNTISFSVGEEELRHLNTAQTAGDYAAWSYFQSLDTPENRRFVQAFQNKFGPQRLVNDPMQTAYAGVKLWAQAVRQAGRDDVRSVRSALFDQRLLAPEGELRIQAETQHSMQTPRIGQIGTDGQFKVVWSAASPEPPLPFPASRPRSEWEALLRRFYHEWGDRWGAPGQ
jgi:urea transport system substrate-binding protein